MVHPQRPALPLARRRVLSREGAVLPAFGTQGTVCTRYMAGCKESTRAWSLEEQVMVAPTDVGGGDDVPSPDDEMKARPPRLQCLLHSGTVSALHASALYHLLSFSAA